MANEIIQGDSGTILSLTIQDDSQIVDLTNATVEVAIKFKATGILKQAVITDAVNGLCEITLDEVDIPHEGVYSFQATVRFTDGKKFSSNIERFTVLKKLNYTPNVGGGNSNIGGSATNGNILINGLEVKVYDDAAIRSEINSLKNGKHTHSNLEDLERLGINTNNKLTIDGVEIVTGGNGTIGADGKSAYQIWLDNGNSGTVQTFLDSLKGEKGDTGLTGATGQNGLDGKSAYQIWLDAGNTGTESDFLLSLKGEKGDSGTGGGTIPSNVIYFEDWLGGESVTIDTGGTIPPADTTAPNNITNLSTSNVTATSLTLSWTASTSSDVASYEVYRGSTLLTTVTGTTYNATGLTEKIQYTFTIKAKDSTGNIASGTSVTITTADVTVPNNVTNLTPSNVSATSLTLNWTASTSTDVSGYEVYNGSTLLGTVTGTSYSVSGLTANTVYTFTVKAKDASNNISSGISVNVTTSSVADTTPPNPVTNLTVGTVTPNSIPVSWTLSTSNDVSNYEVAYSTDGTNYTVSSSVVNASSTSYTVTGLTASTNYTIRVIAIDGAGNRSTAATVNAITSAPADTTPPVLTITPAATFADSQTVTMSINETADIWYTTDGSDPVSSGTRVKYSSALTLTATTTVKAYAVDTAGNASGVQTVIYSKEAQQVMTITASPSSGTYASSQSVALSTSVVGGTIYYTTDGSLPTISSTVYSGTKINWTSSGTIRAIVKDSAGNVSSPQGFYYYIGLQGTAGKYSFTTTTQQVLTKPASLSYDEVALDVTPKFITNQWQYYIDLRTAGLTNGYLARTSSAVDEKGAGFSSISVNGNPVTSGTAFVTDNVRQTISAKLVSPSTLGNGGKFFSTGANHLNGDVYGIKFLLNGDVVANFDFTNNYGSTQIVPDTVNGLQLTNNGIWVQ